MVLDSPFRLEACLHESGFGWESLASSSARPFAGQGSLAYSRQILGGLMRVRKEKSVQILGDHFLIFDEMRERLESLPDVGRIAAEEDLRGWGPAQDDRPSSTTRT
jgi:hypothetical protein